MIVDSQVHLWKAETPDWPWVPGRVAQLPESFTIEKLVPLMDEAGVDRAVIVPPSWPGDRNDYGLEAVKRYPGRFAVMGRIPLEKPE
jgi:predicted TIM-barrel fold metal-dependent hydrolase